MGKKAAIQKGDGMIQFRAEVAQVKTMSDGGIRIAFDIAENETEVARALMDCRVKNAILEVAILPRKP
jgi:hypothetical protein